MDLPNGTSVLISQRGSCHAGEIGETVSSLSTGSLVRVRDCVHWIRDDEMTPVKTSEPVNPDE